MTCNSGIINYKDCKCPDIGSYDFIIDSDFEFIYTSSGEKLGYIVSADKKEIKFRYTSDDRLGNYYIISYE